MKQPPDRIRRFAFGFAVTLTVALFATAALGQTGVAAYRALGLKPQEVLAGTVLNARVVPGEGKQVVCVATYLTGEREKDKAVNVRLGIFRRSGSTLTPLYSRDFGADKGGQVGNGDLVLLDVDMDGISEIVVTYDDFREPLLEQRRGEVIVFDGDTFSAAWTGLVEFDATKAAREVPETRRDRFVREFDWPSTLRSRGKTLFLRKTMIAVAGERLAEPKVLEESFPLLR